MADIDAILRESLNRLAKPGDPKGVAEAIRARLGSGGSGPSSTSSGGSPFHGPGGAAFWIPLATLALVVAVAGAAAGFNGAIGRPQSQDAGVAGLVANGVHAYGCPGGAVAEELRPGTRVLALERSDDGSWLGIRDPYALTRTVWLPAGAVVVDAGQPALNTLEVGGCPVAADEPSASPAEATPEPTLEPTASATATVSPTPTPKPADKVKPSISTGAWSVSPVFGKGWTCGLSSSKIKVTAMDNVGVAGISASTTFPGATVTLQSHSGSSYLFVFQMPAVNPATGTTGVTFTARDAAGNARAITVSLAVNYCLI